MEIVATGMVTPTGLTAAAGCAALRAGIAGFDELPYYDLLGEPIVGAAVPGLVEHFEDEERLVALLCLALQDLLRDTLPFPIEDVPLFIGLAEPSRPGRVVPATKLVARVQQRLGLRFHPRLSQSIARGHAGGPAALRMARELLDSRAVPACIVAGIDSYLNGPALAWLEQHGRLKTPGNSNGVIPGEAAAAVLLRSGGNHASVRIRGLGFALERTHVLSEEPFLGQGLAAAARQALAEAALGMHDIHFRLSDVTGETYGFKELALVSSRLLRQRVEAMPVWHSADTIGDTGAAAGVCQLVLLYWAFRRGYAVGSRALCLTSSISGERAAVVVDRVGR